MNILQVSAEVAPYAKVGGLADVTGALPPAWAVDGHTVVPVLPLYGTIDQERYNITPTPLVIAVPCSTWTEYATVYTGIMPDSDVTIYFIRSADYFDRPGIYGYHDGFDDNDRRFLFLCRAAFELAKAINFQPDIIHAHDYHTAPMMAMLAVHYRHTPHFATTKGVFTIHNMAYQGVYDPARAMDLCGFPAQDFYHGSWYEHHGMFNAMKTGIMFASKVTTVSPTYAEEIRWTPEGMGLQGALQARSADVIGVLNGIDTDVWSPRTDPHLPLTYTADDLNRKEVNKRALLLECGLTLAEASASIPLMGMVTRLTHQKGVQLLPEVLPVLFERNLVRMVLLGSGQTSHEEALAAIAQRYPRHLFLATGYDEGLSHRIQAGSDYYLMPSLFEPCGLTQLFAMAYGTIPIVRAVGGLADTVEEYDAVSMRGTGFRFQAFTADALGTTIEHALRIYRREPHWSAIRCNAMSRDHSIQRTAQHYIDVFTWA